MMRAKAETRPQSARPNMVWSHPLTDRQSYNLNFNIRLGYIEPSAPWQYSVYTSYSTKSLASQSQYSRSYIYIDTSLY